MATLQELKQEATELGIEFSANIGATKLAEKIEAFYSSQENSEKEIQEAEVAARAAELEAEEQSEAVKPAVSNKADVNMSRREKARLSEARARKTRIVTVTDNDTRENNQTTVAPVNCTNMYFDLGTAYIPLNVPVEVRQGHIDILNGIDMTLHVKQKDGLFKPETRKRYSIHYEDVE